MVRETFIVDRFKYTVLSENGSVGTVSVGKAVDNISGDIVIPSIVKNGDITYRVREIGSSAFSGCNDLTSVIIPDSVLGIEWNAFSKCSSLKCVYYKGNILPRIRHSDDDVDVIIDHKFYEDTPETLVSYYPIENKSWKEAIKYGTWEGRIAIPWDPETGEIYSFIIDNLRYAVHSISKERSEGTVSVIRADDNISGDIVIPATVMHKNITYYVTEIGWRAFCYCSNLKNIIIPDSVTMIENSAFWYCSGLKNIIIPNGVIEIGEYDFQG